MPVLVRNVSEADHLADMEIPTRPDGSFYRYEMVCDGGWSRLYDDSVVGLMTYLIPGYTRYNDAQRLSARIAHAVDSQVQMQARINAFFAASPRTQAEDAILNGPRHAQPQISQWDCQVPLLLVDAFYEPYTPAARPVSGIADVAMPPNLWWLRPTEGDSEYLRSLHEAGVIDLHIAKDEVL